MAESLDAGRATAMIDQAFHLSIFTLAMAQTRNAILTSGAGRYCGCNPEDPPPVPRTGRYTECWLCVVYKILGVAAEFVSTGELS